MNLELISTVVQAFTAVVALGISTAAIMIPIVQDRAKQKQLVRALAFSIQPSVNSIKVDADSATKQLFLAGNSPPEHLAEIVTALIKREFITIGTTPVLNQAAPDLWRLGSAGLAVINLLNVVAGFNEWVAKWGGMVAGESTEDRAKSLKSTQDFVEGVKSAADLAKEQIDRLVKPTIS